MRSKGAALMVAFWTFGVTACATVKYPSYYKNSNAMAIEKGIDSLNFDEAFGRLPAESKVTLKDLEFGNSDVRLDGPYYLDENTNYQIEQIMLEKLHERGVVALERDPQIVSSLLAEQSEVYQFSVAESAEHTEEEMQDGGGGVATVLGGGSSDDAGGSGGERVEVNVFTGCQEEDCGHKNEKQSDTLSRPVGFTRFDTPLRSADFIIAYRILDCGVYLQELGSDDLQVERVVKVKLHLRISSTKSSEIIYAGRIESIQSERMDVNFYDDHQWIPYQDFDHTRDQAEEESGLGLF